MKFKLTRQTHLCFDALEGRSLQTGLATTPQVDKPESILPSVEQDYLVSAPKPGSIAGGGRQTQIIAILIG